MGHSRSPAIHNAAFAALNLDWVFVALPVAVGNGQAAVEAMRTLRLEGLSVTMPHKSAVVGVVDRLTPAAEVLGVCNCLYRDGDQIVGHNTDGDGFVSGLEQSSGVEVGGKRVTIFGGGGAARAIVDALSRRGAEKILVVNRTISKAQEVASLSSVAEVVGHDASDPGEVFDSVLASDIVINASAIGMDGGPAPRQSPIPDGIVSSGQIIADIVYQPRRTVFLGQAADAGAASVDGLGMLIHQAALAFELWTGEVPPLEAMGAAANLNL